MYPHAAGHHPRQLAHLVETHVVDSFVVDVQSQSVVSPPHLTHHPVSCGRETGKTDINVHHTYTHEGRNMKSEKLPCLVRGDSNYITMSYVYMYTGSINSFTMMAQVPRPSQLRWGLAPRLVCHYSLDSRPLPDFISHPWRKIGRRPGIIATSQTGNGGLD